MVSIFIKTLVLEISVACFYVIYVSDQLWDIRRKGCIFTYGHKLTVNSLKFSPDGQWIASGGEEGIVRVCFSLFLVVVLLM